MDDAASIDRLKMNGLAQLWYTTARELQRLQKPLAVGAPTQTEDERVTQAAVEGEYLALVAAVELVCPDLKGRATRVLSEVSEDFTLAEARQYLLTRLSPVSWQRFLNKAG